MENQKREEFQKAWAKIVTKAWSDPEFKKELLKNPQEICKKYGLDYQGKKINIVEKPSDTICLFLPERSENLSEEELNKVSAGFCLGTSSATACTGAA